MLLITLLLAQTQLTAPAAIWVHLGAHGTRSSARNFTATVRGSAVPGNRLHNYLTVQRDDRDAQRFKTLAGPFTSRREAFRFGARLLESSSTVQAFALVHFDGSPVSLKMRRSERKHLLPWVSAPYPQLGIAISSMVLGWSAPPPRLGSRAAATITLGFRDEVWFMAEKKVCSANTCKLWHKALTPAPHRIAWFSAGAVVPLRVVHSQKDDTGKLLNYTAVSVVGSEESRVLYQAIRFLPGRAPFRAFFSLPRLFYLKLRRDKEGKWKAVDRRGVEHYQLSKYSQWRPVPKLFRRHGRVVFFN